MNLVLKRTPGIYLAGFMGSGKSTVGRMLAERLGWTFVDLDERIEAEQGMTISKIFAERGEHDFRRIEHEALAVCVRKVRSGHATVVALGGGTFAQEENIRLLTDHGISIWIDTVFSIVKGRVKHANHRPLARDPERFAELFQQRRDQYGRADYRIELEVDDSAVAVQRILDLPLWS